MPLTTALCVALIAYAHSSTTGAADPPPELCLLQLKDTNGERDEKLERLKAENEELKRKVQQKEEAVTQDRSAADPLREKYLETVSMGLLGGLTHEAYTDPTRGGTTDYQKRNQCLTRDWSTGGTVDACILKWDAYERMKRVQQAYEDVRENGVAGDLIECGVWRGGITIWMKALLTAYGDSARNVWVSDSFSGVPNVARQEDHPEFKDIPDEMRNLDMKQWGGQVTERGIDGHMTEKNILTVEGRFVEDNFKRFGLLDDKVKFLVGYFNDTLPTVRDRGLSKIAVLRVDGDLYSSTEVETYIGEQGAIMMLVANKIDLADKRQVTTQDAQEYAAKKGCMYIECSAKTSDGINQAFEELVEKILETPSLLETDSSALNKINVTQPKPDDSSCAC